jgi:hypothetical protein
MVPKGHVLLSCLCLVGTWVVGSIWQSRIAGKFRAKQVSERPQGDRSCVSLGKNKTNTTTQATGVRIESASQRIDEQRERAEAMEYQTLLNILDRFEVPRGTANHVLELKQGSLFQRQEVLANTNLPAGEKQVWLQVLREQVGETLSGVLGPKCFNMYYQTCGSWVDGLGEKSGNWESGKAGKQTLKH